MLNIRLSGAFVSRLIIMQQAFVQNVRMKQVVFFWIVEFCLHKIQNQKKNLHTAYNTYNGKLYM